MAEEKVVNYQFPSVIGILGIVFVTLKLCKVIDWSWWWVTAPFWIPVALVAALFLLAGVCLVGASIIEKLMKRT